MTNLLTREHLTDAQLYELLDKPTHASGTHLHVCTTCQQELARLRASLENFRLATTNLASAELPPLTASRAESASPRRFAFRHPIYAATFATAAVLLTASVTLIHPHRAASVAPALSTTQSESASAESDAALLDGIQRDLAVSVPTSLSPLEVGPAKSSLGTQN